MEVAQLKEYIIDNNFVKIILTEIKCHSIKYHSSSNYWSCANKDGDNKQAIVVKNNENLSCANYTRQMIKGDRATDIIDLVAYNENLSFPEALKFICNTIGIEYYHDFNEDVPESLIITKLIYDMRESNITEDEQPLKPISERVLSYYKEYVNDLFLNDYIDYETQREFEIGYDELTNRISMPVRSEIGDLIGIKGRLFATTLSESDLKYMYLEPCPRSKVLYGLNKTHEHIKRAGKVYVVESEKAVMQLWSAGYRNAVGLGGKIVTNRQKELLTRLGADIVFCFDKDVTTNEVEILSERFLEHVPIYAMIDKNNILNEKESPSDDPQKWLELLDNSIYRIR